MMYRAMAAGILDARSQRVWRPIFWIGEEL